MLNYNMELENCWYSYVLNNVPLYFKIAEKSKKTGLPRYIRFNNQGLYSGNINHFTRDKLVAFMKDFIKNNKEEVVYTDCNTPPYKIKITLEAPINLNVARMKSGTLWVPDPKKGKHYIWDLDNFLGIWSKKIIDDLTDNKIITDDSINYINQIKYKYMQTKSKSIKIYVNLCLNSLNL